MVESISSALRVSGDAPAAGVNVEESVALDADVVDVGDIAILIISVVPA